MAGHKKRRWRDIAANLALLVVASVAAFLAGELLIRQLPASDLMGWSMVPPVPERLAQTGEKAPGVPRLLILGDSFTEWRDSTGESYPRVAGRQLAEGGRPVEVVNLGEAGTGLTHYMGNLLRYGPALRPDVVVVGLYLGNDLVPSDPALDTPQGEGAALRTETPRPDRPLWWRLLKKSVALNFAYRVAKQYVPALQSGIFDAFLAETTRQAGLDKATVAARLARVDPAMLQAARSDAINGWDLAMAVAEPDYYGDLALVVPGSAQADRVERALRDLRALVTKIRATGAEVMVVLLPPPVWVAERYQQHFRQLGYGNLGPVAGELPLVQRVKAELGALGVPVVDPLPALRASTADAYLPRDIHLNRVGQRLVGEAVAAEFLRRSATGK